jgi:hypothetical protein
MAPSIGFLLGTLAGQLNDRKDGHCSYNFDECPVFTIDIIEVPIIGAKLPRQKISTRIFTR